MDVFAIRNIVLSEAITDLIKMADHPSMSSEMQWALRHAAKMFEAKKL